MFIEKLKIGDLKTLRLNYDQTVADVATLCSNTTPTNSISRRREVKLIANSPKIFSEFALKFAAKKLANSSAASVQQLLGFSCNLALTITLLLGGLVGL